VTAAAYDDTDQVPAWVAYSGVLVVGGTALAVLAWYQHQLGLAAKMPWLLSWTFSIGLDWGSIVGGVFWFFGTGALARWGRFTAVSLVLVSTVLTCIAWGRLAGWQWAFLGLIHPAVAFLMAKLLTLWQARRAYERARSVPVEVPVRVEAAPPPPVPAVPPVPLSPEPPLRPATPLPAPRRATSQMPDWQARCSAGEGGKLDKAMVWLEHKWEQGLEPTGTDIDAVVSGSSTGRTARIRLREQGIYPPSERVERNSVA
jgi:hypothetical protein